LQWVSIEELYRDYPDRSEAGSPCVISREGSNFVFGSVSSDGTLRGIYWAKQAFLRDTDPSWYSTNAPEVLLYGSLLEATPFIMGDERIPVWQGFYNESISTLQAEEMNSSASKGQLIQRVS
jgi:hypothetical protein